MKPKISIIVPIYGVEKYLNQCVDSILAQTFHSIEVILVDDGSPDLSGAIADAYAEADPRIRVIHQKNAGLGSARNAGMRIATGEYVGFVDSDDWVQPEMFEKLYEAALKHNADIVVSGHCDYCEGKQVKVKKHPLSGSVLESKEEILRIRKNLYGHGLNDRRVEAFPMSVCMSIYKMEMIATFDLRFQHILSEDTIFNLAAYLNANVIAFTDHTDYCYRKEEQASITQTFSDKKIIQFREFLAKLMNLAEAECDEECILRAKRTAIDYCRLYTGIVDKSKESFSLKKKHIQVFSQCSQIQNCWKDYPVNTLPFQQRIFQEAIVGKKYGTALMLNRVRQILKKREMLRNAGFQRN